MKMFVFAIRKIKRVRASFNPFRIASHGISMIAPFLRQPCENKMFSTAKHLSDFLQVDLLHFVRVPYLGWQKVHNKTP